MGRKFSWVRIDADSGLICPVLRVVRPLKRPCRGRGFACGESLTHLETSTFAPSPQIGDEPFKMPNARLFQGGSDKAIRLFGSLT
jgi:hypothetical protein